MVHPASAKRAEVKTANYSRPQFTTTLEELVTEDNLMYAYKQASKGKQSRTGVYHFTDELGQNLMELQDELLKMTYIPYPCRKFEIFCRAGMKHRIIAAPSFRDMVVQHLFYQCTYDAFDRGFIFDSYGCRRGKGTHKASDRVQEFIRRSPDDSYYLQIDIRRYYYSIDHAILRESLERRISDKRIVDVLMMFCDEESSVGLNVGCLTSQLFGMIYLDRFDHWVKRTLKIKHYVRYVDDMVFIGLSKSEAYELKEKVERFLYEDLNLTLSKWKILPVKKGINFSGFWAWKDRRFVRKRSLCSLSRSIKRRKTDSIAAILAHAKRTSSYSWMLKKVKNNLPVEEQNNLHRKLRAELSRVKADDLPQEKPPQKAPKGQQNIKDLPKHLQVALSLYQR